MFSLRKLIVKDSCDKRILKILKPGEYLFSDPKFDNFFLNNVTVSSIVGKNGCGKSSLIELVFRMVNNLGAMMLKKLSRPAADALCFVEGIEATLEYDLDSKHGSLICGRNSVELMHGEYSFCWHKENSSVLYEINGKKKDTNDYGVAKCVADNFFYLIATNYSMQSFIDADYRKEIVSSWQPNKAYDESTNEYVWGRDDSNCWINGVFHKNDGYMCPIVLNPYRDNGKIDMAKEEGLTVNRLCALMLQFRKENYQIIEGYRLASIRYIFNQGYLLENFDRQILRDIPAERISDKFLYVYFLEGSYAKAILDGYGINAERDMNYIELTLRLYLVYKTFSIAEKYPQYSHFRPLGNVNNAFKTNTNKHELELVYELAKKIMVNSSHIELKVHQTIYLIRNLDILDNKNRLEQPMTYEEFNEFLNINTECDNVMQRFRTLPPPLFRPTIYLIKNEDYDNIMRQEFTEQERKDDIDRHSIPLSDLSSGERQFIYMTSTLLYHAHNILSIPDNERLAYRNLCMVLDEVEICFHPEYQRTFLSKLLSLIERNQLNTFFGISILIITHSPFVLSDIPKDNILYLENGENVSESKHLNTFGANVNELLAQSFFLSGGFMGEFASDRIDSLANYLSDNPISYPWTESLAKELIDLVGDELIQFQLQQMYAQKFKDTDSYKAWIKEEAERLGIEL